MSNWISEFRADIRTMSQADGISTGGSPVERLRKLQRIIRRSINRCWRDREVINAPRVFCQNSGGCGSTYIVKLLQSNGVANCFHEKSPDLNRQGLEFFEDSTRRGRIVRLLRYTRHDVRFEASNRLFSFSRELKTAFPQARFIHLHRHAADAVCSAMSKPDIERYLATSPRFVGTAGGPHDAPPFERFCHYWANINGRILNDLDELRLDEHERFSLAFNDLISGNMTSLESFLGVGFHTATIPAANVGRTGRSGRFPGYRDWAESHKEVFHRICDPVLTRLGYPESPLAAATSIGQLFRSA
ncbi:MAG: hypothetical protein AAF456_05095 [Planctomycetota bacterium]